MLLQFLLALVLFGSSVDGGPHMDPNGIVLGDGITLSDGSSEPPVDPPDNYTGCIDPNG